MHEIVNVTHEKKERVLSRNGGEGERREWGILASPLLTPVHPFPLVPPTMSPRS